MEWGAIALSTGRAHFLPTLSLLNAAKTSSKLFHDVKTYWSVSKQEIEGMGKEKKIEMKKRCVSVCTIKIQKEKNVFLFLQLFK